MNGSIPDTTPTSGPQHLIAANAALATAHSFTGPRDDIDRFNRHMRLFEAHLAAARFAFEVARAVGADGVTGPDAQTRIEALTANTEAWIAAIAEDGQR